MWLKSYFIIISMMTTLLAVSSIDPYKVIGVSRDASEREIKVAYRKLAKHWHPDKNKAENAPEKFMQINQAYEVLSDSDKKAQFDQYGTVNTNPNHDDREHFYDNPFHGFEEFFHRSHGFHEHFGSSRKNPEESINKRLYDESIFPQSHFKPFFIYTYTDFCFSCYKVEHLWNEFKQELKNIGIGVGHLDASWNRELARNIGVNNVPSIVAIINRKVFHYAGDFSLKSFREFVRKIFPKSLIKEIDSVDTFNSELTRAIEANKVFALLSSQSAQSSLRYKMPCLQFKERIKCVYLQKSVYENMKNNLFLQIDASSRSEVLMIFKESSVNPVLTLQMNEIPYSNFFQTFESNKYLNIPRVTSKSVFDELCPAAFIDAKLKYCVILLTESNRKDSIGLFYDVIKQSDKFLTENVQFTYIYKDVQIDFVNAVMKDYAKLQQPIEEKIAILKRLDDYYMQYELLDNDSFKKFNIDFIKKRIKSIIKGSDSLDHKIIIPKLNNESDESYTESIIEFFEDVWNYLTQRFHWSRLLSDNFYILVILCTFLFFWLVILSNNDGDLHVKKPKKGEKSTKTPNKSNNKIRYIFENRQHTCHELHEEISEELLKSFPKNFVMILFVINENHREIFVPYFEQLITNFKSSHFLYFYLNKDTQFGLNFLNSLFDDDEEDSNRRRFSNSNICSLAINIHKSYFTVYEPECLINSNSIGDTVEESLGFDEHDLLENLNELNSKLFNWLEKLDEGVWNEKHKLNI